MGWAGNWFEHQKVVSPPSRAFDVTLLTREQSHADKISQIVIRRVTFFAQ